MNPRARLAWLVVLALFAALCLGGGCGTSPPATSLVPAIHAVHVAAMRSPLGGPVHSPLTSPLGGSVGGHGLNLFGAGVDTFTKTTKTINSSSLVNFQPGQTLGLIYFGFATSGSILEDIVGSATAPLFAKGWGITNQYNGAAFYAGSSHTVFINAGLPLNLGLSRFVFVWRAADNHFLVSMNGGAFADKGVLATGPAPDGTSATYLGEMPSDAILTPLTSGSVCAWTILGQELSQTAAQALSATPLTTSRFSFTAGLAAAALAPTFDFDAYRDWNGNAASIVTRGSSPITFAVTGAPTRTNYSETRIPTVAAMYFDGKIAVPESGFTLRNAYARLRFSGVSGRNIGYDYFDNFAQSALQSGVGCYSNGAYVGQNQQTFSTSGVNDFILPAGSSRAVDLWEGNQVTSTVPTVSVVTITYIRVPYGSALIYPATPPQKRFVLLGDSIMSGFFPSSPFANSVTALLRVDYPTTGTGGVTCHCWGGNSLYYLSDAGGVTTTAATAALLAAELDGSVSDTLWIQLGINDFAGNYWSAATFGTAYGALLDAVHALRPSATLYCQTPFPTVSPFSEAANGHGNTASDYRTQVTAAATARSGFCVPVDGSTIYANTTIYNASTAPTGRYYTDGLHNDVAANGTHDIKAAIKTAVGYSVAPFMPDATPIALAPVISMLAWAAVRRRRQAATNGTRRRAA